MVMNANVATYHTNERCGKTPAELEPTGRVVADHVFESIIKAIDAESPRNGDALEEDEPQEDQVAASVTVK